MTFDLDAALFFLVIMIVLAAWDPIDGAGADPYP